MLVEDSTILLYFAVREVQARMYFRFPPIPIGVSGRNNSEKHAKVDERHAFTSCNYSKFSRRQSGGSLPDSSSKFNSDGILLGPEFRVEMCFEAYVFHDSFGHGRHGGTCFFSGACGFRASCCEKSCQKLQALQCQRLQALQRRQRMV